jgi:hypothetical protein
MIQNTRRAISWLATVIVAGTLAACGGGAAQGDQCKVLDPSRDPSLPGCTTSTVPVTTPAAATLKLSLTDAAGAAITTVTVQRAGTVQALLKDASGKPLAGIAVTFTTSDKTASLVPASGAALTDAAGIARIGVVAGTQAGGFTVTASATAAGAGVTGTLGYAVGFPTLTLSPLTAAPSPLAAGGTATLAVTVMDGAQPFAPAQSVSFTSPCAAAGKATISSPVITVAGVASTSYIDKGCGAADTITATTSLGGATSSQTASITVLGAVAGQLAFVSASPQNIAIKGTGGPGRQESSTVTFKVLDKNGNPVAGAAVNFLLFGTTSDVTGTGGLMLNPANATSGADGTVSTTLFAGIVNTPVRVTATIRGSSPAVTSTSDQLVISTGIPDQNSFSLSTSIFNVEGANFDGCPSGIGSTVTVSLADHFNNPVPEGTAVSFTAEGGTIGASCQTGWITEIINGTIISKRGTPGACSVQFCAANPRPADGRVTIMAYALGEESFVDNPAIQNGINRFDTGETFQDLCEPFRNDRAIRNADANSTVFDSKTAACPSPVAGEPYIDSNGDGKYNAVGDGQYNGVLNVDPATGQTVANSRVPTVHVRQSLVQVMSGSTAVFSECCTPSIVLSHCTDGTPFVNVAQTFRVAIRDGNPTIFPGNSLSGNILPAGTRIDFTASNGTILGNSSFIVPNTNDENSAAWTYTVQLQSDAAQTDAAHGLLCTNTVSSGSLAIKVTTPQNVVTGKTYPVTD